MSACHAAWATVLGALLATGGAGMAQPGVASVTADLVARFDQATPANAMDASVRLSGVAGGVTRRAVFLHPQGVGDATLTWSLELPAIGPEDHLLLLCSTAISDGAKLEDPDAAFNGVLYAVEVQGERLWEGVVERSAWSPLALDLSRWAGQTVGLRLVTNAIAENANYDWALWGEPMVVKLEGRVPAGRPIAGTSGVLVAEAVGGAATFGVTALDQAGTELASEEWRFEGLQAPLLTAASFDFSAAEGFAQATVTGDVGVRAYLYPPELRLVDVGAASAVLLDGRRPAVRARIRNVGRGAATAAHGVRAVLTFTPARRAPGAIVEPARREWRLEEPLPPGQEVSADWELPGRGGIGEIGVDVSLEWYSTADRLGPPWEAHDAPILRVWPDPRRLSGEAPQQTELLTTDEALILQNAHCRLVVMRDGARLGPLLYLRRSGDEWVLLGDRPRPCDVIWGDGEWGRLERATWDFARTAGGGRLRLELRYQGGPARVAVEVELPDNAARLDWRYVLRAERDAALALFGGPEVRVGDQTTGTRKQSALFPGLEYLGADEPSSSTRDFAPPLNLRLVPDPQKVTMPLMAVATDDGLVTLAWDQNQRSDGEHWGASARFASPNFADGEDNHLLGLFLPTPPDFLAENDTQASTPYTLRAGEELSLAATLWLDPPGDITGAVQRYWDTVGFPAPERAPRDLGAEIELSRWGFMHTVWDEETQRGRHCIGWAPANAPGFATLLLYDAMLTGDQAARDRAELIARQTLEQEGEVGLASPACCHILRWELPFHWGHLAAALEGARNSAYGLLGGQQEDGSWAYHPGDDPQRQRLGKDGDAVLGTCAVPSALLLRYARLTGDQGALAAGLRGLAAMRRFQVPAGAQGWECPIYEPDILAAAWAVAAYVEGYECTGDRELLAQAVRWARSGVPFCYAWQMPDRPGSTYATIPVFGSTFFTHSWLGVPVQWCGLVYAYHLQHLARYDQSWPWVEIARGITTSGMYQQFGDEDLEKKGTYPDGWYGQFTQRNAPFINPEDIILNRLALEGYDPDPQTAILQAAGGPVHLSGPGVGEGRIENGTVTFTSRYFPGQTSYCLVAPTTQPQRVEANGEELLQTEDLEQAPAGWRRHPERGWLELKLRHPEGEAVLRVTLAGVDCYVPPRPVAKTAWEFADGTEGWVGGSALGQLHAADGLLTAVVVGVDPYLMGPETAMDAQQHPHLRLRARATAGTSASFFFVSDLSPGWGPDKQVDFPFPGDGEWHELEVDMGRHPQWRGTITGLRFDLEPETVVGARLDVDWIRAQP